MNYLFCFFVFLTCFSDIEANSFVYSIDHNITTTSKTIKSIKQTSTVSLKLNDITGIRVYNLNKEILTVVPVSSVYLECYDSANCLPLENRSMSMYERDMLSLYISFVNACGKTNIDSEFGLGLIRSKDSENTMGMYSENYNSVLVDKAFWVRLTYGNNFNHVYDHTTDIQRVIALLELACHERSHYDKPNWSHTYAHSNEFQVNYNTIYHRAIRNLYMYEDLYNHILYNNNHSSLYALWIFLLILFLIVFWSWFVY